MRTGAPWRDLPPDYGSWGNTHRRFIRWGDKGIWEKLLETIIDEPDYEWLMIDASHVKVHPYATGARGGNQDMGKTKGGSTPRYIWPWMCMVCRLEYLLHRLPQLIVQKRMNWKAQALLADCGYDSDAIIEQAQDQGMEAVIPPKKNRKDQRYYDKHLYKI